MYSALHTTQVFIMMLNESFNHLAFKNIANAQRYYQQYLLSECILTILKIAVLNQYLKILLSFMLLI